MIVTRKRLPRRTFLRGLGTIVALPWLDAMVPAFAAPADKKTPVRLVFGYVPNGMMMKDWTPTAARHLLLRRHRATIIWISRPSCAGRPTEVCYNSDDANRSRLPRRDLIFGAEKICGRFDKQLILNA